MISDELREFIKNYVYFKAEVTAIADRIDAEHEDAIKKLSADFDGQLYCESFVNWAVMDKFAVKQRDLDERVSVLERKLNHKGGVE